jgi:hypothetical protein
VDDRKQLSIVGRIVALWDIELAGDVGDWVGPILKVLFEYTPDAEVTGIGGDCKGLARIR